MLSNRLALKPGPTHHCRFAVDARQKNRYRDRLNYRPGKIDTGKVIRVSKNTGEGQIGASAQLPRVSNIGSKGFISATIRPDDEDLARELSLGEASAVAIYTQPSGPFAVVSKIYIRMLALMFFLP